MLVETHGAEAWRIAIISTSLIDFGLMDFVSGRPQRHPRIEAVALGDSNIRWW